MLLLMLLPVVPPIDVLPVVFGCMEPPGRMEPPGCDDMLPVIEPWLAGGIVLC